MILQVVFETTRSAKACVDKFDQTNKMGNTMTVFTDPLGKERQSYIDEKVYGIPRRQVDYPSEFIPRPEVYVEPPEPMAERTHTPHIPTEQPVLPSHSDQDDIPMEEDPHPDDYVDSDFPYSGDPHFHPPHEPYNKHSEGFPTNGCIDYNHQPNPGGRHWGGHHREFADEHSRGGYYNSNREFHQHSRGDYHPNDRFYNRNSDMYDRRMPPDRPPHFVPHKQLHGSADGERGYIGRSYRNDPSRGDNRDARYSNPPPEHYREANFYPPPPSHEEAAHDRRSRLETSSSSEPPAHEARQEPVPVDNNRVTDSDSEGESSQDEHQPSTPVEEEAVEPAALDLDSRIQMMLNQNKDLAGFGAPEPVTATPAESVAPPPPINMPLEPQTSMAPPINYAGVPSMTPMDPAFNASKLPISRSFTKWASFGLPVQFNDYLQFTEYV